ncbi:uncharacterized protein [Ptychodera flava]|uniref:uncharacterized protein n=1 Tax=Ptychodera flava TaxID=63121 RepID=UPI00396A0E01
MLPTFSRFSLLLVAIVTFCETVNIIGGRRIIQLPHGQAVPLKSSPELQEPLFSESRDDTSRNGVIGGGDFRDPFLSDALYPMEVDDSADNLKTDSEKVGTSDEIYVKPKYQRMDEFADPNSIKHGPKKIVGGNQELEEFGLWQPPNSEIEDDYSGDYYWKNYISSEDQKFPAFRADDAWQWENGYMKRENQGTDDDGLWVYEIQEKEKQLPNNVNKLVWLNKQYREWLPLGSEGSIDVANDNEGQKNSGE